jgi:hypothetical protein
VLDDLAVGAPRLLRDHHLRRFTSSTLIVSRFR